MWMLHCDKVSKYVSESMDRNLSFGQRLGVRFHLLMCSHCARFAKQLHLIRSLVRSEGHNYPQHSLREDVKNNIKKRLQEKKNR
ncbi:MAG: hypothetical protein ACI8ZB_000815 [Desulforhopalus sp.]|jgi:hypothetical protein